MVQFVPLKVDTDGQHWGTWSRAYPHEGQGIPIIYVIRADGEKLYGKSGGLSGDVLPQFMKLHLGQAGRVLSEQESAQVTAAVEAANKALADNDSAGAMKSLLSVRKIGLPGSLGSYAKPAAEADELAKKLIEQATARVEEAKGQLSGDLPSFEAALAVAEVSRGFSAVPELRTPLASVTREVARNAPAKQMLDQAEALDNARSLLASPAGKTRAFTALRQIVARYPNTPAARAAEDDLGKLDVAPAESPAVVATSEATPPGSSAGTGISGGTGASTSGSGGASAAKRASSYLLMAKTFASTRPEKAREYAQKTIDAAPESEYAAEAKRLLGTLK